MLLFEHNTLALSVSCFFPFSLSFTMAAPSSVNINFSAKIDLNLSISVLLPTDQVFDASEKPLENPIPTGCNENLALTNMSEDNDIFESPSDITPVQRCSSMFESDLNASIAGPFSEETLSSLANVFASFFDASESSLGAADCLPLSSPASPSFSEINPNDLFWIPLPEMDLGDSVVECGFGNDEKVVVEIIACESDQGDEEVVFLKEVRRTADAPKSE